MTKRCDNCNQKLNDNDLVCPNCGKKVNAKKENVRKSDGFNDNKREDNYVNDKTSVKTNVFSLIGFVLTLVSIIFSGFSLFAFVFSVIGLIDSVNKGQKGRVLSIISILLLIAFMVLRFIFTGIFYLFFW